jgi:RNA polymerase sigma-70 factor (ECF subfamily)
MSTGEDVTEAVAQAYRAYYRRLVAIVYAATGDYADAQDVVQEAYAAALDRPQRFRAVADPQAWLCTVALNFARQRWRRRQFLHHLLRTGRLDPSNEQVPGASADLVDLVRALRQLSRPTRETLVLHHLLDLPVAAVAEELGVSVGTVKSRLSRGRAALGDLLAEQSVV